MIPLETSLFRSDPPPQCPAPFNLTAHVLAAGRACPDKIALGVIGLNSHDSWTYGALTQAVLGTATGLLNAGLKPGDKIMMRLGNTVDFPIAYLGAIAAGCVPAPTSAQLTAPELNYMAKVLKPAAILQDPDLNAPKSTAIQITLDTLRGFHDLPAAPYELGDPNRPAYVVFTSGTSGKPRAVVHAHRAIWARRMMIKGWYDLQAEDRLMHAGAFNWTFTLGTGLMDPWSIGATALIAGPDVTLQDLPALLYSANATIFAAAPGVFRKILQSKALPDLPNLRHALSAGEKLPAAVARAWENKVGTPIYEAYGMSECSTFISGSPSRPAPSTALGSPQAGRTVAMIGPGGPVPIDTVGQIAIARKDPGVMLKYLSAPKDTAARFQGEWFMTGDLGRMNAQGAIIYQGRSDDMMNAGGFRVSPIEVEHALSNIPGITDLAATEVSVKANTTVIAVFYTGPAALDDEMLQALASERLARYKCPRIYSHIPELPRSANGKLLRRVLRTNYEASNG